MRQLPRVNSQPQPFTRLMFILLPLALQVSQIAQQGSVLLQQRQSSTTQPSAQSLMILQVPPKSPRLLQVLAHLRLWQAVTSLWIQAKVITKTPQLIHRLPILPLLLLLIKLSIRILLLPLIHTSPLLHYLPISPLLLPLIKISLRISLPPLTQKSPLLLHYLPTPPLPLSIKTSLRALLLPLA